MSIEQNRENVLERERRELFAKAAAELAKDFQERHADYSEHESAAQGIPIVEKRWKVAQGYYKSVMASVSTPPPPNYYEYSRSTHREQVALVQETNANNVGRLWKELERLFMTSNLVGTEYPEEPRMSEETAKELVILLAKVNKHR